MMKGIIYIGHLGFLAVGLIGGLVAMLFNDLPISHYFIIIAVLYFLFMIAMNTESVDKK